MLKLPPRVALPAAALPLLALLALAAEPAVPVKPEAAAPPAGLEAVPAAEFEKLRREYWKVEVVLRDGTTRVRGDLAGYSSVEGLVHVATDPASPYYHEKIRDEEVRSVDFLGDARARPVEPDDFRRRLAAELKAAHDAGRLDELIRQREDRLKKLDSGGRWGDRLRNAQVIRDEIRWLTAAYCEREGKYDAEAVQRAQARILELPMTPGFRLAVQRHMENLKRHPDGGPGRGPGPEEPPPPEGRR